MLRALFALMAAATLAGCEVYRPASYDEIARARYESPEPPSVTLVSMVNRSSGRSAHVGLLINGSEQVLYDPAGTFTHPDLPRRGDIHYGMTPRFVDYYERYHARFDFFVEAQKVPVSRATADQLIANAKAQGQSMKMTCALDVADVLQPVPPFQNVPKSIFPEALRENFASMAGVEPSYVYEFGRREESRVGAQRQSAVVTTEDAPLPEPAPPPGPDPSRRPGTHRRMSSILLGLVGSAEGERVSLGEMVDAFDARAYGPLIVLFAAPNILPVALPGISAVLGVPLMLLTAQLMLGLHRPWLPDFLRRRSLARASFESLVHRIVPRLVRIEAMIRPRLLPLTGAWGKRLIGAVGMVLAAIVFLPVPFGNAIPGIALVLMAVGLLSRDGVAVVVGGLIGAVGLAVVSGFVYGAVAAVTHLARSGLGV